MDVVAPTRPLFECKGPLSPPASERAPVELKVEVAVAPKDAVPKTASVLVAVSEPVVAEYSVPEFATIEGVEIVPFVPIVVVPVAPNDVRPKKVLEFANWAAP